MSETTIQTDVVYEHERLGEVLVTGIAEMYEMYSTDESPPDASENETLVFYYDQFDGYGGMSPGPNTEEVHEFAKMVEEKRSFDYPEVSELEVREAMDRVTRRLEDRDHEKIDPEDYTE